MIELSKAFPSRFSTVKEGIFGIEIETEVTAARDYPKGLLESGIQEDENGDDQSYWIVQSSKYWKGVHDGSLRNFGVEFILKEPLSYHETIEALKEFGTIFKDVPFLENQPGTSVHVHLNFQERTLLELATFVTVFSLVENLLTEVSGQARRSNLFAKPHRVAEMQMIRNIETFKRMERGESTALNIDEGSTKYSVLNFSSLPKLGTLEVRCFRGTTDVSAIIEWIQLLHEVYNFARRIGSPRSFMNLYRTVRDRHGDIVNLVFNGKFPKERVTGLDDLVRRNEYYMVRYATSVDDWDNFGVAYNTRRIEKTKRGATQILDEFLGVAPAAPQPSTVQWSPLLQQAQYVGDGIYSLQVDTNNLVQESDDEISEEASW